MIRFCHHRLRPYRRTVPHRSQKSTPDFKLTAVYSRTGERAAEFAAQWGAALTFTDLLALPPAARSMPSTSPAPISATPSRPSP